MAIIIRPEIDGRIKPLINSGYQLSPNNSLNRSLISWWLFNERSSDRLFDVLKANDLIRSKLTWTPYGYECDLDTYAYLNYGLYPGTTNPWSILIYLNGPVGINKVLFGMGSAASNNPIYMLATHETGKDNKLRLYVRSDDNTVLLNAKSAQSVFDSKNHTVLWTDDGANTNLYIDGQRDSTAFAYARNKALTLNRTAFFALLRASAGNFWDNGQIFHAALFNRALGAKEAMLLHSHPFGTVEMPRLYFVKRKINVGSGIAPVILTEEDVFMGMLRFWQQQRY